MFGLSVEEIHAIILNSISNAFYELIVFENEWWWSFGLIGGLSFIVGWALKENLIAFIFFNIIFLLSIVIQPLIYFMVADLTYQIWGESYVISDSHIYA